MIYEDQVKWESLNGAGKSTLGKALASRMGYEFIDCTQLRADLA